MDPKKRFGDCSRFFAFSILLLAGGLLNLSCEKGTFGNPRAVLESKASIYETTAELRMLEASLIRYKTHGRLYPTTEQGLKALVARPATGPAPADWHQLIEPSGLTDPWGNPYQYRYPGIRNPGSYDVWSTGPDGIDGNADDIHMP